MRPREPIVEHSAVPPEIALVLRCAAAGSDGSAVDPGMISRSTDWEAVCAFAVKHAIVSLVAKSLSVGPAELVPDATQQFFREAAMQNAVRGLRLASDLVAIITAFETTNVSAIPVKGPTLALLVYGDLSLRSYEDLDILVRERDLERAIATLELLGYHFRDQLTKAQRQSLAADAYHVGFAHDASGTNVELHWLLNHRTLAHADLERRWWEKPRALSVGGLTMHTLAPEEMLLYLCIHGGKHSWARLSWLCDLRKALRRFPEADWETIWRVAEENGVARMVGTGLALVNELLDGAPLTAGPLSGRSHDPAVATLVPLIVARLTHGPVEARGVDFRTQLLLRERLRDRARYAAHVLAAPHHADVVRLELPPSMRRMYYILRPARLAWKHLMHRGHRSRIA